MIVLVCIGTHAEVGTYILRPSLSLQRTTCVFFVPTDRNTLVVVFTICLIFFMTYNNNNKTADGKQSLSPDPSNLSLSRHIIFNNIATGNNDF
jgi:hypothetical protein